MNSGDYSADTEQLYNSYLTFVNYIIPIPGIPAGAAGATGTARAAGAAGTAGATRTAERAGNPGICDRGGRRRDVVQQRQHVGRGGHSERRRRADGYGLHDG